MKKPSYDQMQEWDFRHFRTSNRFSTDSKKTKNIQIKKLKSFIHWIIAELGPYSELGLTLKSLWFQGSFRAVSEQFQSSFREVLEQFSYDFLMENLAIQNPDLTLSQVENKGPGLVYYQIVNYADQLLSL